MIWFRLLPLLPPPSAPANGVYLSATNTLSFATNSGERLSIDSNGNATLNGISLGRGLGNVATNTVFGNNALDANTTGDNNTAIGDEALGANTEGVRNTAVGALALDANTTADNNTGLGYGALSANTTGTRNVAVGSLSLDANTTADDNTGVGYNTLSRQTPVVQIILLLVRLRLIQTPPGTIILLLG